MKSKLKLMLSLAAFVFAASFGYAQNTVNTPDSITISTQSIPNPIIYISNSGNSGGGISKDVLMENPFLIVKDVLDAVEWEILSYKVTFVSNGKEDVPIMVTGSQFTEQIKSRIQSASSGTIIEFSDIKVQSIAGIRDIGRVLSVRIR